MYPIEEFEIPCRGSRTFFEDCPSGSIFGHQRVRDSQSGPIMATLVTICSHNKFRR